MQAALVIIALLAVGGDGPSAQDLEKRVAEAPQDLAARAALLERYFLDWTPEGRAARVRHALWVIEHAPESEIAGTPYAQLNHILEPADYERARALWLARVEADGTNPKILAHASSFLLLHDRSRAEDLLLRGIRLEPDNPEWRSRLGHLHDLETRGAAPASAPAKAALERHEEALARTAGDHGRYLALGDLADAALRAGENAKAREYALELLELADSLPRCWNYGNAIHDGHRVLGHLALLSGDSAAAREHLLAAGATPGSPQLDSFGPELTLAKELLAAGDRATVVEYLRLCERFWKGRTPALRAWSAAIQAGRTPDLDRFEAPFAQP
jgi:hypothetical protein